MQVSDIKIGLRVRYHNTIRDSLTLPWQDKIGNIVSSHSTYVVVMFDDLIYGLRKWRVDYKMTGDINLVPVENDAFEKERNRREEHAMKFL